MGKHCNRCRQAFPSCDDHLTCSKCQFTAGIFKLDASNPCSTCENWLQVPGGSSGSPSEMPGRNQPGEELGTGRAKPILS